jgi:hypothetical protein
VSLPPAFCRKRDPQGVHERNIQNAHDHVVARVDEINYSSQTGDCVGTFDVVRRELGLEELKTWRTKGVLFNSRQYT